MFNCFMRDKNDEETYKQCMCLMKDIIRSYHSLILEAHGRWITDPMIDFLYICRRALKEAVHDEQTIAFNRLFTVHLTLVHESFKAGSCRTLSQFVFSLFVKML